MYTIQKNAAPGRTPSRASLAPTEAETVGGRDRTSKKCSASTDAIPGNRAPSGRSYSIRQIRTVAFFNSNDHSSCDKRSRRSVSPICVSAT
ncbi:hypothetical protein SAMN03159453_03593 [Pseudomonas sp. NFIX28]|nr:hypothetical protein SAMN03159453_03593 [Pseudomonas sp. NFIX28]